MEDTAKYLIHATIAADGVVERSDVVGAVFGQTEGLLGEDLDLRDLQQSSKVGRIDVAIESENGQSFGEVTVASSLDKVETAILAAALETITRVGPCHASIEVTRIEDVRAAKRREVVDRAKELLVDGFEETSLSSDEVLEEVRDSVRIEGIADYEGLPAGPRVADSDAVIVVEGRADVLTLLECGIKNAIAVEGTNVPDAVADLTLDRTVTAFLDGDRGGELILRELEQVGDIDFVAFAPAGRSVEDLDRGEILDALRGKVPYGALSEEPTLREAAEDPPQEARTTETSTSPAGDADAATEPTDSASEDESATSEEVETGGDGVEANGETSGTADGAVEAGGGVAGGAVGGEASASSAALEERDATAMANADDEPPTLREHVREVIDADSGRSRLIDADGATLTEVDAEAAFDAVENADTAPNAVVVDGEITQRLLDVAAQRGVSELFGRSTGSFVKQPVGTRVRTADELRAEA